MLVVVENMSRYVWILPLRILSAASVKSAFEKLLKTDQVMKNIRNQLRTVLTDNGWTELVLLYKLLGGEFMGKFHQFLMEQHLKHRFTNRASLNKSSLAENAIKIIKMKLGRVLEDDRSDVLTKLKNVVKTMNSETHSLTRPNSISASDLVLRPEQRTRPGAPKDAIDKLIEQTILHYRRYALNRNKSAIVKGIIPKFVVGDTVRIALESKNAFRKVSDQQFSSEIYIVDRVILTSPLASYKLSYITPDRVKLNLSGTFSEIKLKRDFSTK